MEKVKFLLSEIKKEIGISEEILVKIVPMKEKIASVSIDKGVLRLNKNVVDLLDEKELRYILLHELVHFKVKEVNHGTLFMREIEKYLELEKTSEIELGIIRKLIHLTSSPP